MAPIVVLPMAELPTTIFQGAVPPWVNTLAPWSFERVSTGEGTTVTESIFELTLAVAPPPETLAWLVFGLVALDATFTFSVRAGKSNPEATTVLFVHVMVWERELQLQPVPDPGVAAGVNP